MSNNLELSVIAPVYNGEDTISEFIQRSIKTLQKQNYLSELILVDDGSPDRSWSIMAEIDSSSVELVLVRLKRNYGQSNALTAGCTQAKGKYIVLMDSDLQDKPEDIPKLYKQLNKEKTDMIIAKRPEINHSVSKNIGSVFFFQISRIITTVNHPAHAGVFRIMRSRCLEEISEMLLKPGTLISQIHAAGYSWKTLNLPREKRNRRSGYDFRKRCRLALSRLLPFNRIKLDKLFPALLHSYIPEFSITEIMRKNNE